MASTSHPISKTSVTEKPLLVSISGYALLVVALVLLAFAGISFLQAHEPTILSVTLFVLSLLIFKGMSVIAPNEAVITTFLGTYMGTMKKVGCVGSIPFIVSRKSASVPGISMVKR